MLNIGTSAALAVPRARFLGDQKFQCANNVQKHATLAMTLVPGSLDIFTATVAK